MRRIVLIAAAIICLAPSVAPAQAYGDPASLVDYWYRTYLGRPADSGITYWINHLQQGDTPDQVLAGILASDEYYKKGGATPQGFVTTLYNDVLHRPPNANEVSFWVGRMYTESRQDVADEILTQNPGVWVGANTSVQPVVPPVTVSPGVIIRPYGWERDRHDDWDRRYNIHDYRRPDNRGRGPEHHDDHHK